MTTDVTGGVARRVVAVVEAWDGPCATADVMRSLPTCRAVTLAVELRRLVEAGVLVRVARGRYAFVPEDRRVQVARASRDAVVRTVTTFAPGRTFGVTDVTDVVSTTYGVVESVFRDLLAKGLLRRVSRGVYALPGAPAEGDDPGRKVTKYDVVRRILSEEDRDWTTGEVQARLDVSMPGSSAVWLLGNMTRGDNPHAVRTGPGTYRLASGTPGARKGRGASRHDPVTPVERVLAQGGLWRISDLEHACALPRRLVEDAVRHLDGSGRVVNVALGHWRHVDSPCDLLHDGRTVQARVLGSMLDGSCHDVARVGMAAGLTARQALAPLRRLVTLGLVLEPLTGCFQCPEEVADTVRLASGLPEVSDRPVPSRPGAVRPDADRSDRGHGGVSFPRVRAGGASPCGVAAGPCRA